jgi:hypothetical protein
MMAKPAISGDEVELGKKKILEGLQEIFRGFKVDQSLLIFRWEFDGAQSQWLLRVYKGTRRYVLGVNESDVKAWPTVPEVTGKYVGKMLNLAECVLRLPEGP